MMGVVIIAILSFVGCNYNSEKKLKEIITSALEEKYDEAFVCLDVWANGGSSYWGVCAPEKNHDIRFKALFLTGGKITYEGYYAACVAEQIEKDVQKKLESVFSNFYLHSYMTVPLVSREVDDVYAENVKNELFDIDGYVNSANEKWSNGASITLILLVKNEADNKCSFEDEYNKISDIVHEVENMGIRAITYLKFLPQNMYSNCVEYLETRANISSTFDNMVRDYPIKASDISLNIYFEFEGNTLITITQEEYMKQRKEVS